jgi:hypothetical protein
LATWWTAAKCAAAEHLAPAVRVHRVSRQRLVLGLLPSSVGTARIVRAQERLLFVWRHLRDRRYPHVSHFLDGSTRRVCRFAQPVAHLSEIDVKRIQQCLENRAALLTFEVERELRRHVAIL